MRASHNPLPSRPRGFTLLEMLVVLILVGLITGILFQALNQVFRMQSHFGDEATLMRQNAMLADWFRQLIEGVQPDYEDGKNKFQATERRIKAQSTNPLNPGQGALAPFILELRFDSQSGETQLRYGEDANAPVIMSWPGDAGRFVFLDVGKAEYERWPPPMVKKPVQIPAAIRLEGRREGKPWILWATPLGPEQPPLRIGDFMGGTR